MMDRTIAERFHASYNWFWELFTRLSGLFDAIGQRLGHRYKRSVTYPPFAPTEPKAYYRLPDPIFVCYERKDKDESGLPVPSVVSVLSEKSLSRCTGDLTPLRAMLLEVLKDKLLARGFAEPKLAVFMHDPLPKDTSFTISKLECRGGNDAESFQGELEYNGGRSKVRFSCSLVPLDAFSIQNCPDTNALVTKIDEVIVNRLDRALQEDPFRT